MNRSKVVLEMIGLLQGFPEERRCDFFFLVAAGCSAHKEVSHALRFPKGEGDRKNEKLAKSWIII